MLRGEEQTIQPLHHQQQCLILSNHKKLHGVVLHLEEKEKQNASNTLNVSTISGHANRGLEIHLKKISPKPSKHISRVSEGGRAGPQHFLF